MTVYAQCLLCSIEFTVYDLSYYPAAAKLAGNEEFLPFDDPVNFGDVFVMFEYSEPELDVEFDPNDISWCQIFVRRKNGAIDKIFDDETC